MVGYAINFPRPEMALKRGHDNACLNSKFSTCINIITVQLQQTLQSGNGITLVALLQKNAAGNGLCRNPVSNTASMQVRPVKFFAGVDFAPRGNIRMCKNMLWQDMMSCDDVAGKRGHTVHLHLRKIRVATTVARVLDFNTD